MSGSVRIGLVGCGRIGQMHARLLDGRVSGASIAMVQDELSPSAEQLAAELNGELSGGAAGAVKVAASAGELIASDEVDAVAICASTDAHVALLGEALAAGKPAFCEKPLSLDLAEVDRLIAAAGAASGKAAAAGAASSAPLVHVGFNRRFDPGHGQLARRVRTGEIGQLHLLRITSRDPSPPPMEYVRRSGGVFFDMVIHDFDMARFVVGSEVVEVFAAGEARITPELAELGDPDDPDRPGDYDTAVVVLRHEDSTITTIDNSRQATYGYDQRIEAFGSGGMLVSENPPEDLVSRHDASGTASARLYDFFIERYEQSYISQWEAFAAGVASGGGVGGGGGSGAGALVSLADGRAPLVLAKAATISAAEHRAVLLSEI